jgi:hypothetical protein
VTIDKSPIHIITIEDDLTHSTKEICNTLLLHILPTQLVMPWFEPMFFQKINIMWEIKLVKISKYLGSWRTPKTEGSFKGLNNWCPSS